MTDAEYKRVRKRIRKAFRDWSYRLGLRWWRIDLVVHRDPPPDKPEGVCAGYATVRSEYLEATVAFYATIVEKYDRTELEKIVRHELCHVLVHEMRRLGNEENSPDRHEAGMLAEERVVTCLEKAFEWTYTAGCRDGREHGGKKDRRGETQ